MSFFGNDFRTRMGATAHRDAVTIQRAWRDAKISTGCESPFCHGYPKSHKALAVAHIDASTKHRTAKGTPVEPADMVKSDGRGRTRYSSDALMREADKCRILCHNCHAVE